MNGTILFSVFVAAIGYGVTFPYLAGRLEAWGIPGLLLGLNAAMPALGWFVGSFLLPMLQARFAMRTILVWSLAIACLAWAAFPAFPDQWAWMPVRFVFGGAIGLYFRSIEFGLNAVTDTAHRGRVFGWYGLAFGLGIAVGAALEPVAHEDPLAPWIVPPLLLVMAALPAWRWRCEPKEQIERPRPATWAATARAAPLPLLAGFVYGFGEDIPAYLLSIYALRNGLGADVAAYSLTAAALGTITFPLVLGIVADRRGRRGSLMAAAVLAAVAAAAVPFSVGSAASFLGLVVVTIGFSSAIYTTALAMLGDRWPGRGLNTANAAFGASYALGGLIGPLVNGTAIDTLSSHGLMVSAAAAPLVIVVTMLFSGRSFRSREGVRHD